MENIGNYAMDIVDERDFDVEVLLGAENYQLPEYVFLSDGEIQNQNLDKETLYACVFFTGSSISNTMNFYAKEPDRITGKDLAAIAFEKGLLDRKAGAYVSSSPKLLKELGYIKSYARCYNQKQMKLALAFNKPIQTGSVEIDWGATSKNNNIATGGGGYGHSFFICGYDDKKEHWICENSVGEHRYDRGYFYIKYEDTDKLLFNSKYIMTDTPRENYDQAILDNIDLDLAKEGYKLGIFNGQDPRKPVSRQEAVVMIMRVAEKIKAGEL